MIRMWLHRKGFARVVSVTTNSYSDRCSAVIDTRGPKWIGEFLWQFALARYPMRFDGDSRVIADYWRLSDGGHRWKVTFRRP